MASVNDDDDDDEYDEEFSSMGSNITSLVTASAFCELAPFAAALCVSAATSAVARARARRELCCSDACVGAKTSEGGCEKVLRKVEYNEGWRAMLGPSELSWRPSTFTRKRTHSRNEGRDEGFVAQHRRIRSV